ncbi:MAG TPA: histidine triad nucleotide-binding protein [Dehalococcoidia bacterium]|nr:histidine triad nucleotide-binding protein [Dehalococcoidia bacterium]
MAEECLFCRIVAGEIPSDIIYQDNEFLAFRDINPQAPKHIIIIPKTHITSLAELTEQQQGLIGRLVILARDLADKEGIAERGYRLAINCGPEGGQVIPHLHLHLIGGRKLNDRLG